ncbi:MAG: hypothetical protein JW973_09190 [Bacteroidales bacterium]|nr:hypothetical protein [Bacteroidales bacterium]
MKRNVFIVLGFFALFLVIIGCEENTNDDKAYTDPEPVDFFMLTDNEMVDSIACLLSLSPFSFSDNTLPTWEGVSMGGIDWITGGKKFINSEDQSIIIWIDENGELAYLTYCDYRQAKSGDWGPVDDQIQARLDELFLSLGFFQKNNEMFRINKCAGGIHKIKWFEANCTQTFHNDTLEYPYFTAELEGDTSKINFMKIPVWYKNLDAIRQKLPDVELKSRARTYFQDDNTVLSIPDVLSIEGYWIIYNKLCKKIGYAIIDEYGSSMNVFIDIQNGEVIEKECIYIR